MKMLIQLTLDHITELGFRILLWCIYLYLDNHAPYIRHIEEEELWYYRYPSMPSYVPLLYLYIIVVGVPAIVFFITYMLSDKDEIVPDIRNQFYGITLAYCTVAIFTACLKLIVGRPRPNFFLRCFPDGIGMNVNNCTGEWYGQMDGRKSFPSGHASLSFAGMVYITCYLFRTIRLNKPRLFRGVIVFICLMPMLIAVLISLSRACDYHHHFSDILGGSLIGTNISLLIYYIYNVNIYTEKMTEDNLESVKQQKVIEL